MITKICKYCDKEYEIYPCHEKHTKFCSKECMYADRKGKEIIHLKEIRKKGICLNTGKTHFKKGIHPSPKTEFKKGHIPWSKGKCKKTEIKNCKYCGNEFEVPLYREKKYCSKKCVGKDFGFQKGVKSWITGKKKEELREYYKNGWKGTFKKGQIAPTKGIKYSEDRIKLMSGKNSARWEGGKSTYNKRVRNSQKFKDWRIKNFERDNYTCQKCMEKGGELRAHHFNSFTDYPELRFDIDNGVTLCLDCHIKIHKKYGQKITINEYIKFIN